MFVITSKLATLLMHVVILVLFLDTLPSDSFDKLVLWVDILGGHSWKFYGYLPYYCVQENAGSFLVCVINLSTYLSSFQLFILFLINYLIYECM